MKFTSHTERNINTVYCVGLKVISFTQYQLEHVLQCYVSYQDAGLVCYWWYIASIQLILFFRKFTQDTYLGNNTQTSLSYSPKKKCCKFKTRNLLSQCSVNLYIFGNVGVMEVLGTWNQTWNSPISLICPLLLAIWLVFKWIANSI